MLCFAFVGAYVGSPINYIPAKIPLAEEIVIMETSKNVWEIKGYFNSFNMKGWYRQIFYITNILAGIICINSYNNDKQIAYSLPFGSQKSKIKNVKLVFIKLNKKTTTKYLIENYKVKKSLNLRIRLLCSLKATRGSPKNIRNYKYYKMELKDCFRFYK